MATVPSASYPPFLASSYLSSGEIDPQGLKHVVDSFESMVRRSDIWQQVGSVEKTNSLAAEWNILSFESATSSPRDSAFFIELGKFTKELTTNTPIEKLAKILFDKVTQLNYICERVVVVFERGMQSKNENKDWHVDCIWKNNCFNSLRISFSNVPEWNTHILSQKNFLEIYGQESPHLVDLSEKYLRVIEPRAESAKQGMFLDAKQIFNRAPSALPEGTLTPSSYRLSFHFT